MESLNNGKALSGAEQKIEEYVDRIKNGESKDFIFQGLPESFKSGIEKRFAEPVEEKLDITKASENREAQENKNNFSEQNELSTLSVEERKKLHGWSASYELAKIAKQQGIDLSKISREEYVDFAVQHSLAIDDDQLRAAPWQRMGTSTKEIVFANRERKARITKESEKAFAKFCYEMQQKAGQENRFLSENIKVRQGTKDSNSWLFFGINNGTEEESNETYKAYVSLKDLNVLTPERFTQFMAALRDAKYNGDIKIFQDPLEQGVRLNDQIVMHGGSREDAQLAMQVAEHFFGDDLAEKSMGKDEVVGGEKKSYSQLLAKKIIEKINRQK
jgi:hypothetical protein